MTEETERDAEQQAESSPATGDGTTPPEDDADASDKDETPADDPEKSKSSLWFLGAALLTVLIMVITIAATRVWDPYVCETNADCRGTSRCFDNYCVIPEIWLNRMEHACTQALEIEGPCVTQDVWNRVR
jgi:hypothetical protein